ncbi:MAG TPA: aldose epimerase family protein [Propionibacteriaceae bacterium]|nr:aldose epimerase family protein [Propionibacteriaceae bacterium]
MEKVRIGTGPVTAEIWTLGAALNGVWAPDRDGNLADVVLGHSDEGERRAGTAYLGEVVGPYGNRIRDGRFAIDGRSYQLERNFLARHSLHSGSAGFHRQEWTLTDRGDDHVRLELTWSDTTGEHPGPVHAAVTYTAQGDTLAYDIEVTSDAPTVVNVIGHPYLNLAGAGTVADHVLTIDADTYLPVDDELLPTADAPAPVEGRFDLRAGRTVAEIVAAGGVDHCFVLNGTGLRHVASLEDPASRRRVDVATDEPGLQVFDGRGLDEIGYPAYGGLAMETQHFPDAPNRPDFPSTLLRPGERRTSRTVWTFSAR